MPFNYQKYKAPSNLHRIIPSPEPVPVEPEPVPEQDVSEVPAKRPKQRTHQPQEQ